MENIQQVFYFPSSCSIWGKRRADTALRWAGDTTHRGAGQLQDHPSPHPRRWLHLERTPRDPEVLVDQTAPVFAVQKFILNFQNVSFGAILASPRVPIFRPVPLSSAWFLSPAGARLEPEPRSAGDKRLPSEQPVTCCRGHELKRAADSLLAPNQATTLGPCWGQTKIRPPGAAPRPGASPPPPLTPWGQPAEKICFF